MTLKCTDAFVTLAAADFENLVSFYTYFLGQEPNPHMQNVYAEFQLPGLRLGIFRPKAVHQQEFGNAGSGLSLCLEVSNLAEAIAHLTALGYPPPGEILTASHGREVYAYDPNGNRLILHHSGK